ncbi:MAG: BrnA antitoxin family protein [Treponema sp.]|nr:BrnA antitoxin family protein [Treponema sp.]
MSSSNTLSDERIVEILAFEDTDISDCPELTDEQLARMKPRHPEYFIREKEAVQVNLDTAILARLKAGGGDYETRINELLWQAMRNSRLSRV